MLDMLPEPPMIRWPFVGAVAIVGVLAAMVSLVLLAVYGGLMAWGLILEQAQRPEPPRPARGAPPQRIVHPQR